MTKSRETVSRLLPLRVICLFLWFIIDVTHLSATARMFVRLRVINRTECSLRWTVISHFFRPITQQRSTWKKWHKATVKCVDTNIWLSIPITNLLQFFKHSFQFRGKPPYHLPKTYKYVLCCLFIPNNASHDFLEPDRCWSIIVLFCSEL